MNQKYYILAGNNYNCLPHTLRCSLILCRYLYRDKGSILQAAVEHFKYNQESQKKIEALQKKVEHLKNQNEAFKMQIQVINLSVTLLFLTYALRFIICIRMEIWILSVLISEISCVYIP